MPRLIAARDVPGGGGGGVMVHLAVVCLALGIGYGPAQDQVPSKERQEALEEGEQSSRYMQQDARARDSAKIERREIEEFLDEVGEYIDDHRKAAAELPKLPDKAAPEQVTAYA